jgi:hypothetical protein
MEISMQDNQRVQTVTVSRIDDTDEQKNLLELTFETAGKITTYTISRELCASLIQALTGQLK